MKQLIYTVFLILVCVATAGAQLFNAPENLSLDADENAVTIRWDSVINADHYYIYWGKTRGLDNDRIRVEAQTRYEKTGLDPDTEYFFAVSAVISILGESRKSDIVSVVTLAEETPPEPPRNFWITEIADIHETSVGLKWEKAPDSEPDGFYVYYGIQSGAYDNRMPLNASKADVIVDGLITNTRYYFNISSYADRGETIDESEMAQEIIIDTLPDDRPPDIPGRIRGSLVGEGVIQVHVDAANETMVDYAGVHIYYGQVPDTRDLAIDAGKTAAHTFDGLPMNSTWYFSAAAYDHSGNESEPTDEITVVVEEMGTYTGRFDDFSGGCFIKSLARDRFSGKPAYDVTRHKNKAGISGGYFLPRQTEFDDYYGRDNYPFFLFFERSLHRNVSVDFKAGYMRSKGNMRTVVSDTSTRADSTFTMIPAAASLNLKYPIIPYVWGFVGAGPDYWYIRETSDAVDNAAKWVGGYHGRAGLWLYNMDIRYSQWGMLLETQYSVVDRFGKNDIDVGGWLFLIGGFYSF